MTDYELDQEANEFAHRYRWWVWCFWPAVLFVNILGGIWI